MRILSNVSPALFQAAESEATRRGITVAALLRDTLAQSLDFKGQTIDRPVRGELRRPTGPIRITA